MHMMYSLLDKNHVTNFTNIIISVNIYVAVSYCIMNAAHYVREDTDILILAQISKIAFIIIT